MDKCCKRCKEVGIKTPIEQGIVFQTRSELSHGVGCAATFDLCLDCEQAVFEAFVQANAHYGSIVIEV